MVVRWEGSEGEVGEKKEERWKKVGLDSLLRVGSLRPR